MHALNFLYILLIRPLELLFECVYVIADRVIGNEGLSIIALSLAMNFLVLPLYRRADELQAAQHEKEKQLAGGIAHIKRTFLGDERFYMLQEFYRQNDYKPSHALRGSISLLLEIPFFIAAYRFLSGLTLLSGVSFGPISDLGAPDGLIAIAGMRINLLPILMTLINIISGAIYTKGMPVKTRVQLYLMALIFLVFLYGSPAGLVFYWTLNNIFSLLKNIFYRLKDPAKYLCMISAAAGAFLIIYFGIFCDRTLTRRIIFFCAAGIAMMLPLLFRIFRKERRVNEEICGMEGMSGIFLSAMICLTILTGFLIPSSVIRSSPAEFVDAMDFHDPLRYLFYSGTIAAGVFIVWTGIFYLLAGEKGRRLFAAFSFAAAIICVFDYMVFGKGDSNISSLLQYDIEPEHSAALLLLDLFLIILVGSFSLLLAFKRSRAAGYAIKTLLFALLVLTIVNMGVSRSKFNKLSYIKEQSEAARNEEGVIRLSRTEKNVVIIMMDRAIGSYIPYIMEERPELVEKFDGFTYYGNTISYGRTTNFGAPAIYGGYEYTPEKMNERDGERLADKHDEALKVMPVLFDENGFDVSVCEPPLAGYNWIPDLSIYDDYPDIRTSIINKRLNIFADDMSADTKGIRERNFFCYGIYKAAPLFMQPTLYNGGMYNKAGAGGESAINPVQVRQGISVSTGVDQEFYNAYSVMKNLHTITTVSDEKTSCFNMICNEMTHQPVLLSEPDYVPAQNVDNRAYDADINDRYVVDGRHMRMENDDQVAHYHSNIAAMILLGNWLDYLREEGIYDNTRIIIVSDHGRNLGQFDELILDDGTDTEMFQALLLVKDFNEKGFKVSDEFMTDADVPAIAAAGLISSPVNPFTGKELGSEAKFTEVPKVLFSWEWDINVNGGNTYMPGKWYAVHGGAHDKDSWEYLGKW